MHRLSALRVPYPRLAALATGVSVVVVAAVVYLNGATVATAQQGAARGATVYMNNCQVCHGVNAQGRIGPPLNQLPPEIVNAPRPAIVQRLTGLVRSGIPGAMPRFVPEQLSDADVAALVDFLFENAANRPAGRSYYEALAPVGPVASTSAQAFFPETDHTLAGGFKAFWEMNGGLAVFGFPITEEYTGFAEDGQVVTMQDFERARLEYRDGRVQLVLLGVQHRDLRLHFLGGEGGPPPGQ